MMTRKRCGTWRTREGQGLRKRAGVSHSCQELQPNVKRAAGGRGLYVGKTPPLESQMRMVAVIKESSCCFSRGKKRDAVKRKIKCGRSDFLISLELPRHGSSPWNKENLKRGCLYKYLYSAFIWTYFATIQLKSRTKLIEASINTV